jgi:hypothetical protein
MLLNLRLLAPLLLVSGPTQVLLDQPDDNREVGIIDLFTPRCIVTRLQTVISCPTLP